MKVIRFSLIAMLVIALSWGAPLVTHAQDEVEATAIDTTKPIVLVHGIGGAGYNFASIERHLRGVGYASADLHAIDFADRSGNNLRNSRQLQEFITDVLRNYDANEVNIIAHSMGGSNTLRYLTQLGGVDQVDKVITLGGANRLGASSVPAGVDFTSIYSSSDFIVSNSLSRITGANNIHVTGVSHLGLLTNSRVQSLITEALQE